MTWKTLGEALNGATAKGFDIGEMAAATASQPKKAEAEAPASSQEVSYPPAYKVPTDRCMAIALTPRASPRSAVAIHLVVIEGGLATGGRRRPVARPSAATREGTGGRTVLKLVHAAPRSMID